MSEVRECHEPDGLDGFYGRSFDAMAADQRAFGALVVVEPRYTPAEVETLLRGAVLHAYDFQRPAAEAA